MGLCWYVQLCRLRHVISWVLSPKMEMPYSWLEITEEPPFRAAELTFQGKNKLHTTRFPLLDEWGYPHPPTLDETEVPPPSVGWDMSIDLHVVLCAWRPNWDLHRRDFLSLLHLEFHIITSQCPFIILAETKYWIQMQTNMYKAKTMHRK